MSYSIKVIIRLDKTSKVTNEAPVCLRITKDRKMTYKTLFRIKPEYWDIKNSRVKKSYANANELNAWISKEMADIDKEVLMINLSNSNSGIDTIRNKIKNNMSLDFFEYADNYIQDLHKNGKISLYKRYKTAIDKFKRYVKKETLPISNFSSDLLKNYETYLSTNLKNQNNTITANLKVLSKLIGDIYREYKLDNYYNPFYSHKYKSNETEREYLIEEEIDKIINLKFTPINPLYDAKQIFLFESFTGLRISDILTLKWKNFENGEISLSMRKTERPISIPLSEIPLKIIEQKARILKSNRGSISPEKYIFNILKQDVETISPEESLNSISSATAMINVRLKKIAKKAGISKNISTHIGRHTFATLLLTKGAPITTIQSLLGHRDPKITQIYAKVIDSKKVEAINLLNKK